MLLLAACAIALASPLLAGRWPADLLLRRWRMPWLVLAALLVQVLVFEVPLPDGVAPVLHVGTYVLAGAFLVANRRVPGLLVVAAGAACNAVPIALNGGTLPADRDAVEAAGADWETAFENSGVLEDPVLPWLGDVFAWPEPLPLANVFSVGDVLIVAGVAVLAWSGARPLGSSPDGAPEEPLTATPRTRPDR